MPFPDAEHLTEVIESSQPSPAFVTERHAGALAYWRSRSRDGRLPGRGDLDPLEIPHLLPYVLLFDVEREPLDFRYRLIGTAVRERLASDYTGSRFRAIRHQRPGTPIWQHCARVVAEQRPLFNNAPYVGPDRQVRVHQGLTMPLASDGITVDMLFVLAEFAVDD